MHLSDFNYKLAYGPGKEMPVADCLSRNPRDVVLAEEAMCLALQACESQDFDDNTECVEDNIGHIASAFMMISELPTDSESEFMVMCSVYRGRTRRQHACVVQPAATRYYGRGDHQRRNRRGASPMPSLH